MDNLAPELLHEICTLACTDGGLTGCTLSAISRHIRAASRSARFNSVAVYGTSKQLNGFLSCYKQACDAAKTEADQYEPVVRHLFFAVAEGSKSRLDWRSDLKNLSYFISDADSEEAARRARVAKESTQYREDLATLFRLVSPNLRTLSFIHCNGWYEFTNLPPIQCPEGFPMLQEFDLHGKNPFVDVAGDPVSLPSLTHLRLPFTTYNKDVILADWAERAPNVTHLCVLDVAKVSEELEEIAIREGPFRRLQNLYLQPQSPPRPGGRCGNPYIAYSKFKRDFDNFLAAAVRPIGLLPHRELSLTVDKARERAIMSEWLERVQGDPGYWRPIEPRPSDWLPAERKKVSGWF